MNYRPAAEDRPMAKNCIFYAIQYDDTTDDKSDWYTGVSGPFRATPEEAAKRFERERKEAPEWFSVRLVEAKVLDQVNGRNPLEHVD
jgi:hypothetical protein